MAKKPDERSNDDNNSNSSDLHPIIDGLLQELPSPGDPFPEPRRKLWMQILDLVLQLIYPTEEEE